MRRYSNGAPRFCVTLRPKNTVEPCGWDWEDALVDNPSTTRTGDVGADVDPWIAGWCVGRLNVIEYSGLALDDESG